MATARKQPSIFRAAGESILDGLRTTLAVVPAVLSALIGIAVQVLQVARVLLDAVQRAVITVQSKLDDLEYWLKGSSF